MKAAASASAGAASISISRTPSGGSANNVIRERYGNLFEMYERITDENPYKVPMRIYPPSTTPWADYGWTTT